MTNLKPEDYQDALAWIDKHPRLIGYIPTREETIIRSALTRAAQPSYDSYNAESKVSENHTLESAQPKPNHEEMDKVQAILLKWVQQAEDGPFFALLCQLSWEINEVIEAARSQLSGQSKPNNLEFDKLSDCFCSSYSRIDGKNYVTFSQEGYYSLIEAVQPKPNCAELEAAIRIAVSMADSLNEINLNNYNEDDVGQLNHDAFNLANSIYQIEKAARSQLRESSVIKSAWQKSDAVDCKSIYAGASPVADSIQPPVDAKELDEAIAEAELFLWIDEFPPSEISKISIQLRKCLIEAAKSHRQSLGG